MEGIMTVEKIAVIANGVIEHYGELSGAIKGYDQYLAVDGGLNHCKALHIIPLFLIGDMDSINPNVRKEFPHIKELKFNRDKDATDLELTLQFLIKKNPKSITVFGGLGGRVDHSLTNLILLTRYPGTVFMETEKEIFGVIDRQLSLETHRGQIISLIPMNGPVTGISTDGLKWEIKNGNLDKNFIGISNEATGSSIFITVKTGDLLFSIHKGSRRSSLST